MIIALLRTVSWQAFRHHPWRMAAAVLAVMLGVALGFAVHVINASALTEFSRAVRSVQGEPDLELRAAHGSLPDALYGQVAALPRVELASPWLEVNTVARKPQSAQAGTPLRIMGADTLLLGRTAPALMPRAAQDTAHLAMVAPATVFLNATALAELGIEDPAQTGPVGIDIQAGSTFLRATVAGTIAAAGAPLAVMDIGAAQDFFHRQGELSRIDLLLQPGASVDAVRQQLQALAGWPRNVVFGQHADNTQRVDKLSRAYRVNLTVLALVALFTGAFLVFSILALSVAQRTPQLALLGVLGVTPKERQILVLSEAGLLGSIGSAAGIALGTAMASLALRVLGGDLGGGYFAGVQPDLQFSPVTAGVYALLGVASAVVGGWWPARQAQSLAPAQALKGLGNTGAQQQSPWTGALLLLASGALAFMPPWQGVPVAAYLSVALLLIGGISLLPWMVQWLLRALLPFTRHSALALLAIERARRTRGAAAVAVGGVVASLSLAVALTVMVSSFRESVSQWLDTVVPAPWYMRSAGVAAGDDAAIFSADHIDAMRHLPGIERLSAQRVSSVQLDAAQASIAVLARDLQPDASKILPFVDGPVAVPEGKTPVYVSEAVVALLHVRPGDAWPQLASALAPAQPADLMVAGVWRDYIRQFGAVAMDRADYARITGDARATDIAIWPVPGTQSTDWQKRIEAVMQPSGTQGPTLEFTSSQTIRERSLTTFDRTFAVTYWLQAIAIGIGLFGVAASFSAQVLARRKEFGLLAHLGLTRRQILAVVAGEGAAFTAVGAGVGTLLGLAVSAVLVYVVNPQSFHWTMDLQVPWLRLLWLALALLVSGTVTAWLAGRAAAGRSAVLAVKEDW